MGNTWNITKIIIETFQSETGLSYTEVYNIIDCSDQSVSNWRSKGKKPSQRMFNKIRDGILDYLKNKDTVRMHYIDSLKSCFNQAGRTVLNSLNKCNSLLELLEYLYYTFEKELYDDKLHFLINESSTTFFLRQIILKKFKLYQGYFQNLQIEDLGQEDQNVWENEDISWKLNWEHCFIIRINAYKVLINFDFNAEDYRMAGECEETENIIKEYGVDIILLYSNTIIPNKEIRTLMKHNVYVEIIDPREVDEQAISEQYIYEPMEKDLEMVVLANKYADTVIQKFDKYFSIIFKNVLFSERRAKPPTAKQQESFIFWEAKYATRHHVNFQTKRIEELIQSKQIVEGGCALAIGYLSFPSLLRLGSAFNKIYLMDNSGQSLSRYRKCLEEYAPELHNKIRYLPFSSVIFDSITEKHNLYQKFDFILLGSGSASLIKKIQLYYMICNLWLKKNGFVYASFLNSEFLYGYIDCITEEHNFEYIPKLDRKSATAMIVNSSEKYDLYCNACTSHEIHSLAEKYFEVIKKYSYPLASVIEGTHENYVQNILKELDKEYSRQGFLKENYKNCKGYYVDIVLKKASESKVSMFISPNNAFESITFDNKEVYNEHFLKTILLTERHPTISQIYVVLLSTKKTLPETSNNEICIGSKKFRLLTIAEINSLGIEYRNISPFLRSNDGYIRLVKMYDSEIEKSNQKFYYIGDGSSLEGYKIAKNILLKELEKEGYSAQKI